MGMIVYDCNAKPCPGIYGWNKDSGSEAKWEAFHATIGGKPIVWYRVGTGWEDGKCIGQIEADEKLENAKATADRYGYKVFDHEGKCVYEAKEVTTTQAKSIHSLANEAAKAAAMLELVFKTDKSGILPSVSTAQMILESGYCGTDLALNANNCFPCGMVRAYIRKRRRRMMVPAGIIGLQRTSESILVWKIPSKTIAPICSER